MKVVGIYTTERGSLPDTYIVGNQPTLHGEEVGAPVVREIKFFETGFGSSKIYRGACYAVYFENSEERRIIPKEYVLEVISVGNTGTQAPIPA